MYAVLPTKAKPSKTASKDQTRPLLMRGELVETDGIWSIVTTDSYALSVVPLTIRDEDNASSPAMVAGPISPAAMLAIEKAGAFRANGTVVPCHTLTGHPVDGAPEFPRREDGTFPNHRQLIPEVPAKDQHLRISFDPALLSNIAAAQGRGKREAVVLHVNMGLVADRQYQKAMRVTIGSDDTRMGILMPIRIP